MFTFKKDSHLWEIFNFGTSKNTVEYATENTYEYTPQFVSAIFFRFFLC